MSRKVYKVTAPGFKEKFYNPGDKLVSDKELPKASWYEPLEGKKEEAGDDPERNSAIYAAIAQLKEDGNEKPTVAQISEITGFKVTGKEKDAALESVEE